MIDKELVKKRFKKSYSTYDNNAFIQKEMAKKLIEFLPFDKFGSILEIGCATGVLTKEINKTLGFSVFFANDIVEEARKYIEAINSKIIFLSGDIEEIDLPQKFDLIISNASLQWCNNIETTLNKFMNSLNSGGILAFSVFGDNNLKEIRQIFHLKNNPFSVCRLKEVINSYNCLYFKEEESRLKFDSPLNVLKHLKLTGVNAIEEAKLTKNKLLNFQKEYEEKYTQNGKSILTYSPIFIILQN